MMHTLCQLSFRRRVLGQYILAIDQGTTSSRSIIFSASGEAVAMAQSEFPQHYPNDGWVEHDPEKIWESVIQTVRQVVR